MKEKLKNVLSLEKILGIYIVLQFAIDIATAFCVNHISESLSVGIFIRTAFMIVIVIYSFFKSEKKDKIKLLIYYAILGIYMLLFLFNCYKNFGTSMIITQIKGLLKTFYLPIILVALLPLWKNKNIKIANKYFIYALLGYTSVITLGKFFEISYLSYPLGNGEGTMGLFYAANEIGIIIAILSPFLVYELLNSKLNIVNIISLLFLIFASLELGTKVPFLNLIILIVVAAYASIIKILRKEERKRGILNAIGVLVVTAIVLIYMPYRPISTNIANAYGITIPKIFSKNNEQVAPIEDPNLQTKEEVETAVYSSRNVYLKENIERYKGASKPCKVTGIGYLAKNAVTGETQELKLVEIDYCDILICHGIFGAIAYIAPIIYLFIIWLKNLLKNLKNIFVNQKFIFMEYSILISLLVAFTAGHVFTAPGPALLLTISILMLDKSFKDGARGE